MAGSRVDILMYHSISDAGGATSIAPEVFQMQMRAVAELGVPVLTMDDYLAVRDGKRDLPERALVVTFDDGFEDFATAAWPVMAKYGIRPIVYLPTGFVGRAEGWKGIASPPRALMGWGRIRQLAGEGVLFGSHTVSHPDLTALADDVLEVELTTARKAIEDRLSRPVRHFAPPYGRSDPRVRAQVARLYRTSVGTRLGPANGVADLADLPRIEMFYFTDEARWRAHLTGGGGPYLAKRKMLRAVKGLMMKPWAGL